MGFEYAQISVSSAAEGTVETLSQVAGEECYNIPAVLCKRYGVGQWLYGREALRLAGEDQGVLVENLLALALDGEPVIVDGESFDPVGLLALFFKRSLGNIKVSCMMITCPLMNQRVVEVLGQVAAGASLKADRFLFQSYGESFYGYILRQPEEMWLHQSVLFECRNDMIQVYRLECNRRTRPIVVFIEEEQYAFPECMPSEEGREELDRHFAQIAERVCGKKPVGSVFLIGDRFSEGWMNDSLRYLCRGRRVFQGNNLFSKGACCGMQERLEASQAGKSHVFLGKDKLKANIGMDIFRQGEEAYCALLDAGTNWYEARQETEIYLRGGNEILLAITPLVWKGYSEGESAAVQEKRAGKSTRTARIVLDGLPDTAARIRLRLCMESENILAVETEDLGFGQFRFPSGRVWKESIDIYAC